MSEGSGSQCKFGKIVQYDELGLEVKSRAYQSAPFLMVSSQAAPRASKSAERIEGAINAGGDMFA